MPPVDKTLFVFIKDDILLQIFPNSVKVLLIQFYDDTFEYPQNTQQPFQLFHQPSHQTGVTILYPGCLQMGLNRPQAQDLPQKISSYVSIFELIEVKKFEHI